MKQKLSDEIRRNPEPVMRHGGDIYHNQIEVDFSININPYGPPSEVVEALQEAVHDVTHYPDLHSELLCAEIAKSEKGEFDPSQIVVGNGSSELFVAIVQSLHPQKVAIFVPSFYGYEWAAKMQGEIIYIPLLESKHLRITTDEIRQIPKDCEMVIVANPNNPTGALIGQKELALLEDKCQQQNQTLVVDECFLPFVDVQEEYENFWETYSFANLIRVRAYTKTFAIPGVRLGYALCADFKIAERIRRYLPEWNVSCFAEVAGVACARNIDYPHDFKEILPRERGYLSEELEKLGCKVYESDANFLLFYCEMLLQDALLKQGILIRDCANFRGLGKGYFRIAVRKHDENVHFIDTLKKVMENGRD